MKKINDNRQRIPVFVLFTMALMISNNLVIAQDQAAALAEAAKRHVVELADDKYAALKGEQYLVRKKKTIDYLMQKGYEPGLIQSVLKKE